MEEIKLKKEWQLLYDVLPDALKERPQTETIPPTASKSGETSRNKGNLIAVYTALTDKHLEQKKK